VKKIALRSVDLLISEFRMTLIFYIKAIFEIFFICLSFKIRGVSGSILIELVVIGTERNPFFENACTYLGRIVILQKLIGS
jgi:hypothetical protein